MDGRDAAMTAQKWFNTAAVGLSGYFRDRVKYFKSGWAGSFFACITSPSSSLSSFVGPGSA
jgi:hypothetical protein